MILYSGNGMVKGRVAGTHAHLQLACFMHQGLRNARQLGARSPAAGRQVRLRGRGVGGGHLRGPALLGAAWRVAGDVHVQSRQAAAATPAAAAAFSRDGR
jgi:hypothetical protein